LSSPRAAGQSAQASTLRSRSGSANEGEFEMKKMSQVRKPAPPPSKPQGVVGETELDKVVASGGAAGGVADRA
jgi:hypothetical protein